MATYGVADLTQASSLNFSEGVGPNLVAVGEVRSEEVANQLKDIRDTISTVLDDMPQSREMRLETVELNLTVGAEGGVWFVAKGSLEASIKLSFSRPAS